jgi:hypothetical protein
MRAYSAHTGWDATRASVCAVVLHHAAPCCVVLCCSTVLCCPVRWSMPVTHHLLPEAELARANHGNHLLLRLARQHARQAPLQLLAAQAQLRPDPLEKRCGTHGMSDKRAVSRRLVQQQQQQQQQQQ